MKQSPLSQKLHIKTGQRVGVINAPGFFLRLLTPLPEAVTLASNGPFDHVTLFVRSKGEVDRMWATAVGAIKNGGVIWVAYPKKSSGVNTDITRDEGWDTVVAAGWDAVSQIAIDDTWSALRFRPVSAEEAKTRHTMMTRMHENRLVRAQLADPVKSKSGKKTARSSGERKLEIPPDLKKALEKQKKAKAFFDGLAFTHRKEYVVWITEAKKEDTRKTRVQKTIERLKSQLKNPSAK